MDTNEVLEESPTVTRKVSEDQVNKTVEESNDDRNAETSTNTIDVEDATDTGEEEDDHCEGESAVNEAKNYNNSEDDDETREHQSPTSE